MAGELPYIRMEQGATALTVPSTCIIEIESGGSIDVAGHIDVESGGYVTLESGGYIDVDEGGYINMGTISTETAGASLNKWGVHYLDGASSGTYALPDPAPGSYVLLFSAGLATGKEIEITSTAATFSSNNSTVSTGLLFGSSDSTGVNSAQFAFLVGLTTGLWAVVAKTTGVTNLR